MARLHLPTAIALILAALATGPVVAGAAEAPTTLRGLAEARTAAVDARVLRRLPSTIRSARLTGESDAITWPVWVTAAEAEEGATLRLSLVAAVSVMPEASRLTVVVNDRPVSEFRIASGLGPRSVDVPVPAGALRPGWNALRIGAVQRHRVDCSIASTWELWTEIDPSKSGLLFAAGHRPERHGIADLAGIGPDDRGRVAIRLVTGEPVEPAEMERALRAAQAIATIGGFLDPIVTVGRGSDAAPGIDVLIGRTASASDAGASLQPGVIALVDDGAVDHLTVAIPGDGVAVDRAVADLVDLAGRATEGSEAGVRARAAVGGTAITAGERVSFAELGVESSEFGGRLFRTAVDLRLPADLYPADYAKVQLKLAGGHAGGLDRTSRLAVRVNGRVAAGAPLLASGGEVFTDRTLQIPLSAFRPGHNRIEIEAVVPSAADKSCDPEVQIEGPKRFLFVDRSELVFPNFARLARLPDLAATAAGVFADLKPQVRPTLFVPHPDRGGLSAAATLATRLSIAAGRITSTEIAFRNPPADAPSAIVVGAFADLPTTVVGTVGLDSGRIRTAWGRQPIDRPTAAALPVSTDALTRRVSALRSLGLPGDVDTIATGSVPGRVLTVVPAKDVDLVDRWRKSMESPWSAAAVSRKAGAQLEKLFDFLPIFGAARPLEGLAPTPSTGLIVAQAMSPAGGAWTLVTAPTSGQLAESVATMTGGDGWSRLEGAAVSWDRVEEKFASVPATQVGFLTTTGFDFANFRLVAAALASDYPFTYVLAALLVTGLLGFATARMLPGLGRAKP